MEQLTREEILRPWLSVSTVTLMGPHMSAEKARGWSSRGFLDYFEQAPGRNSPRLYSLANAIQLHVIDWTTERAGLTTAMGKLVGRASIQHLIQMAESGRIACQNGMFFYDMPYDTRMVCGIPNLNGKFKYAVIDVDRLPKVLFQEMAQIGINTCSLLFDVDGLLGAILQDYLPLDSAFLEFNEKALGGYLKPMPQSLPNRMV